MRREVTVCGRCVDEAGTPLAGCAVKMQAHPEARQAGARARSSGAGAWRDPAPQTTGADGAFSFTVDLPTTHSVGLTCEIAERLRRTMSWRRMEPGVHDVGDIALPAGCAVRGNVTDTHGVPQADVRVALLPPEAFLGAGLAPLRPTSACTSADGAFALRAPAGKWFVSMFERRSVVPPFVIIAPDQRELLLAITTHPRDEIPAIRGLVVDDTGAPVTDAMVTGELGGASRTDRDGCFRLEKLDVAGSLPVHLGFHSTGGTHESLRTEETYAWGDADLRFVMSRRLGGDLIVVDVATGAPIEDFGVRCFPAPRAPGSTSFSIGANKLRAAGHHQGGRARLECIARGRNALIVEPSDEAWDHTRVVEFDASEVAVAPLRVELMRTVSATVRVRTRGGVAIAGSAIELVRPYRGATVDLETHAVPPALLGTSFGAPALLVDAGTTDAEGACEVRGPLDVVHVLRLHGPGHVPCVHAGVVLDGAEIAITVDAGGTIAGTVGPRRVLDKLRAWAGASAHFKPMGIELHRSEGEPRRFPLGAGRLIPVDEDGALSIAGVPPGAWDAKLEYSGAMPDGDGRVRNYAQCSEPLPSIVVRDGETTELHVALDALAPGWLRGRVVCDGPMPEDAQLLLSGKRPSGSSGEDGQCGGIIRLDASGAFAVEVSPGTYRAMLLFTRAGEHVTLPARETAIVTSDATVEQVFTVQSASARIRVLGADGKGVAGVTLDALTPEQTWHRTAPATDAEGWTTIDPAPPGTIALMTLPKHLVGKHASDFCLLGRDAAVRTRVEVGRVETQAGAMAEVEVTLPDALGY